MKWRQSYSSKKNYRSHNVFCYLPFAVFLAQQFVYKCKVQRLAQFIKRSLNVFIMPRPCREGGIIKWALVSVCLSVCLWLSLELTRKQKGLGSPKLAKWKSITRVSRETIQRSKGQGHQANQCSHSKCAMSFERKGLRGAFDICWPMSREQKVQEIPKLVGRLPTPRAVMRTSFQVKGQRSRSPG